MLASVGGDSALDALDQGRDETSLVDGLDDFVENLEGKSAAKIKTLEKTLENEKRRLANMELALIEAKKQKQSDVKVSVVTKQSSMLNGMIEVLKSMTTREMEAKQDWDSQWREKFSDLRQQHLDMEAALKRRHLEELKALQNEIKEEIRSLAIQAKESQGRTMPSPRTVQKIQDKNMQRVVELFHKNSQERLYLASKITQQEEMLIRAKSKSLHQKVSLVQTKSNRFCDKLQNLGLQQLKKLQIEGGEESSGALDPSSPTSKKTVRLAAGMPNAQLSRSLDLRHDADGTNSSFNASTGSLDTFGSFRLGASTFVTELDHDAEPTASRKSYIARSHASWTHKSDLPMAMESAISDPTYEQEGYHKTKGPDFSPINGVRKSQGNVAKTMTSFPQQATSAFGTPGMRMDNATNPFPGQEFAGWAQPTSAVLKSDGKPNWNTFPCKWNPNVIALESSVAASTKPAASPYARFAVGERSSERVNASTENRASARGNKKAKSPTLKEHSRSASARLPKPHLQQSNRSRSTEPRLEQAKARKGTPESIRARTTLPQLTDKNNRQQSTDPNFNRPKMDNGDEFPKAAEKYSKLESWIEDKIREVLGNGSTKDAILAKQLASQLQNQMRQEVVQNESWEDAQRYPDERSFSARGAESRVLHDTIPMRDMDPRDTQTTSRSHAGSDWLLRSTGDQSQSATLRATDNSVGSLMSRLRSGMSETAELDASNQGLRVESRAVAAPPGSHTAASINAALHPVRTLDRREVRQSDDDGTGEESREPRPAADVQDRRDRFDRTLAGGGRPHGKGGAGAGKAETKAAKRVGWNLSPRGSEAENTAETGADAAAQMMLNTSTSSAVGGLSRPGTVPGTSASSTLGGDGDDDGDDDSDGAAGRRGGAPSSGEEDDDGGGSKGWSEAEVRDFFSKIRHNKVAEVEEMLRAGFPTDSRDRHGNTPFLVAAQNGHKRLVKMLLRDGADVNATNHQGNTALHFTTSYGYQSLASYLISKGADDTLMNMKGLTCYDGLG